MSGDRGEVFNFFFDKQTSINGEKFLNCVSRGVGTVNDSEAVLDISISMSGVDDVFDEILIVFFFAGVEAEVFEEGDFGVGRDFEFMLRCGEGEEADFLVWQKFMESFCNWAERIFRIFLTFGATEMGD